MPYLVRKILKRKSIDLIGESMNFNDMLADPVTNEFRFDGGGLSSWLIDSIDNIEDAVLAISTTGNNITKMDFIIINVDFLKDYNLEYKQTYAGLEMPITKLQNTHYDIGTVTISKILSCIQLYKRVFDEDKDTNKFVKRYSLNEMRQILKNAYINHQIDKLEKLDKRLKEQILDL